MFKWLRKFSQQRRPVKMDIKKAQEMKTKLSMIYVLLAWNIIGITVYQFFKENSPRTISGSVDYAKLLGVKNATVLQFSGLQKVREYKIDLTDKDIDDFYAGNDTPEELSQEKE